ncbi:hypothetical protein JCM3766R1_002977 [Sporobolomyces carnicolor]
MSTQTSEAFVDPSSSVEAVQFLESVYPRHVFGASPVDHAQRPFVTLTYAQSMDAKIAGAGGKQLILSGPESMKLTHRMRELHDSIMVGIGTMLNDNPQLNARLPTLLPVELQPTPIVLDRNLRTPTDSKLLRNFHAGIGKVPVIVSTIALEDRSADFRDRREALERAGAIVIEPYNETERVPLERLLASPALRPHLGRSLMIEGGSTVISAFLSCPVIDLIIATVAPVYVGEGVDLLHGEIRVPEVENIKSQVFGNDVVFASKPKSSR